MTNADLLATSNLLVREHIARFGERLANDMQGGSNNDEISTRPGGLLLCLDGGEVGLYGS
ncbi:MAG TPA: hypothetical protein VM532_17120 [Burkholderiales bacterium]|nr:hypothetical protein [Burkholderiales bacterium]